MIDYATSPGDAWLSGAPDRSLRAEVLRGHVRVRLYEAGAKIGEGWGHTIPHAMAEALNDVMCRQHEEQERRSA